MKLTKEESEGVLRRLSRVSDVQKGEFDGYYYITFPDGAVMALQFIGGRRDFKFNMVKGHYGHVAVFHSREFPFFQRLKLRNRFKLIVDALVVSNTIRVESISNMQKRAALKEITK